MPATVTTYQNAMKEIWTQDMLEKQFHQGDNVLDQIEKTDKYTVGGVASVPTHMERSGGYTVVPSTGSSSLNGADNQKLDKAQYNYTRHWFEVQIDTAAVERTSGNALAVANAVDTEVEGAINDMRHQVSAQIYGNGTGNIAQCGTTSSSTTVTLNATSGTWAIKRGFLYPGLKIDIGTTSSESSIAADVSITAVNPATPSITVSGSAVTTSSSHYVSIANSRSGSTSYTSNGLGNIVDDSTDLGGLAVATYWRWKSAVDSGGGALTLAKLLNLQTDVQGRRGNPDWNVMSPYQGNKFYLLLQGQARYMDGDKLGAGDKSKLSWNGSIIDPQFDCPDDVWYMITKKNLFGVRIDKPYWVTQKHGGSILQYKQGSTNVVGAAEYMINLATNARSAHGKLTGLS